MDNHQALIQIRMRKLGLLVAEARQVTRRTQEECAEALDISVEEFAAVERGKKSLSLPELEALAYFLNVPLDHFWGNETLTKKALDRSTSKSLIELRNRFLGAKIRMARATRNITPEELSQKTSISAEQINLYELGKVSIPLPELEILTKVLEIRLQDVMDQQGPVGEWHKQQQATSKFLGLPQRLQDFISKPVNQPYLEAAVRLSELNVEKLRSLAEGLIEITF